VQRTLRFDELREPFKHDLTLRRWDCRLSDGTGRRLIAHHHVLPTQTLRIENRAKVSLVDAQPRNSLIFDFIELSTLCRQRAYVQDAGAGGTGDSNETPMYLPADGIRLPLFVQAETSVRRRFLGSSQSGVIRVIEAQRITLLKPAIGPVAAAPAPRPCRGAVASGLARMFHIRTLCASRRQRRAAAAGTARGRRGVFPCP
jgi:hypothetical protein